MNIFTRNNPIALWKHERQMKRMLWGIRPDYTNRVIAIMVILAVLVCGGWVLWDSVAFAADVPLNATAVVNVREESWLNVREYADLEYREVCQLHRGTYVRVKEKLNGWALVAWLDSGREIGWVNMDYLKPRW